MIYHAALPEDWEAARHAGRYEVSTRGASLADVGFIHAAYAEQIDGVLNRFYADVDEVVLLAIDRDSVGVPVVDESVDGERFPHVYGPLSIDAVVAAETLNRRPGHPWQIGKPDRTGRV